MPSSDKPFQSICLDAGPLIKNDPPASTLVAQAEQLYMLPSILDEIRDAVARSRVETTLLPFVTMRNPRPASVKFVTDFARRTGDLEVMSKPDISLLALTYELDVEQNGGDERLRKTPALGGSGYGTLPSAEQDSKDVAANATTTETPPTVTASSGTSDNKDDTKTDDDLTPTDAPQAGTEITATTEQLEELSIQDTDTPVNAPTEAELPDDTPEQQIEESDSDDGWITPSNIKKHQAKENTVAPTTETGPLKVALLTSDYAMQNVALRIGLGLLSPSMSRISELKNWVLRCHGCFTVCKKMDRQFCPKCGQATLTRVSCTTADDGTFKIHLKRNFQWNTRGNVYSIPKPVTGTASGKLPQKGAGGKNGWGTKLMFAEDQKEYERAVSEKRRERKKDLMDDDFLPNVLSGDRTSGNGRVRIGPGRGVNGRKGRS